MKNRQIFILVSGISLIGSFIGYVLQRAVEFRVCYANFETNTFDTSCINLTNALGDAFVYGFGALAIVFLILLAVPKAISAWSKFAIWYVPIAAVIFATARESSGYISLMPSLIPLYQTIAVIYVVVSLVIIFLVQRFKK